MFDTVLGLPVHVLVVHAVVVGLPLMAVVTAVVAFMPTLRLRLAWPVAVADAGVVAAVLAIWWTVLVGHTGAQAVWQGIVQSTTK